MSPNTKELHAIIESMTPNQKGNFTRHCKQNKSSNSNSLVLFDALNKLEEYDEEKLIKYLRKHKQGKLVDNLSVQTTILYKSILRVMRFINDEKNIGNRLWNTFRDAIFLKNQGFSTKAQRILNKVEKDAVLYDIKALQWEVYKQKRIETRNEHGSNDFETVWELNNKAEALMEAMALEEKLRGIYKRIFYLSQNISAIEKDTAKKTFVDLETALNDIDQNQCNCFNTKIYYFVSMAKLYELKADKEAVFRCLEEIEQVFKIYANASKVFNFVYSKLLANYLYYLVEYNRSFDEVSTILTKIKSIEPNTLHEEIVQFSNIYHFELLYYLKQGAFEKIEKLIPALLEGLDKYDNDIELGRKITIYYNLMIYYFIKEDFNSAHDWLKKILDTGKKSDRIDSFNNSLLFELLVNYEFGNTQYLKSSLIPKVKRTFNGDNQSEVVDLIAKLMNAHYRMPLVKKDFELALQKFNKIDKTKNRSLPYDEVEIWLKSKVKELSMQKMAEQMLQNKNKLKNQ